MTSTPTILRLSIALLALLSSLLPSATGFGVGRRRAVASFTRRSSPVLVRMGTEEDAALGEFWGPLINGEDGESYPPFGSLVRQGPVPFFIRLSDKSKYDVAVNNYMAQERCGRREAQGNMDAFFADPNGWALDKIATKEGKVAPFDYANANTNPQQLVLTTAWVGVLLSIVGLVVKVKVLDA